VGRASFQRLAIRRVEIALPSTLSPRESSDSLYPLIHIKGGIAIWV